MFDSYNKSQERNCDTYFFGYVCGESFTVDCAYADIESVSYLQYPLLCAKGES